MLVLENFLGYRTQRRIRNAARTLLFGEIEKNLLQNPSPINRVFLSLKSLLIDGLWCSLSIGSKWSQFGIQTNKLEHVSIFCDSQNAIYLAKNQVHHSRTKHIDVCFHSVREIIDEQDILLKKIGTADNPADMMTKPIPLHKFKHCLDWLAFAVCNSPYGLLVVTAEKFWLCGLIGFKPRWRFAMCGLHLVQW